VLKALLSAVPVDYVNTMGIPADDAYAQSGEPPVWTEYRETLAAAGTSLRLTPIQKWDSIAPWSRTTTSSPSNGRSVAVGKLLLTMGCREV
jgi:L-fucose mutarotase